MVPCCAQVRAGFPAGILVSPASPEEAGAGMSSQRAAGAAWQGLVGNQGPARLECCSAQRPWLGTEVGLDLDLSGYWRLRWDAGQGYGWGEGTEGSLRCSTQRRSSRKTTPTAGEPLKIRRTKFKTVSSNTMAVSIMFIHHSETFEKPEPVSSKPSLKILCY